ncbi:hypothetical protein QR64_19210 [Rhodococcus sp. Chr-9]|nr:hypothetical protein QR64_19210 [Rhodococcus sp. Chr-9]
MRIRFDGFGRLVAAGEFTAHNGPARSDQLLTDALDVLRVRFLVDHPCHDLPQGVVVDLPLRVLGRGRRRRLDRLEKFLVGEPTLEHGKQREVILGRDPLGISRTQPVQYHPWIPTRHRRLLTHRPASDPSNRRVRREPPVRATGFPPR